MNRFALAMCVPLTVFILLTGYSIFRHYFDYVGGAKRKPGQPGPRYRTGEIIRYNMQVLKIRRMDDGSYRYKIRHYNSFFGGHWIE